MKTIVLKMIGYYRKYLSFYTMGSCRFVPTCSQYAQEAVEKYGVVKGLYLFLKRFLKCNPFFKGGYDPLK